MPGEVKSSSRSSRRLSSSLGTPMEDSWVGERRSRGCSVHLWVDRQGGCAGSEMTQPDRAGLVQQARRTAATPSGVDELCAGGRPRGGSSRRAARALCAAPKRRQRRRLQQPAPACRWCLWTRLLPGCPCLGWQWPWLWQSAPRHTAAGWEGRAGGRGSVGRGGWRAAAAAVQGLRVPPLGPAAADRLPALTARCSGRERDQA